MLVPERAGPRLVLEFKQLFPCPIRVFVDSGRPRAVVIAREFAREIFSNIDRYRLRHRCVLKVTTTAVSWFIRERYGIINGGLVTRTLRALARVLEDYGYRCVVRRTSAKAVYYFIPEGCEEVVAVIG